MIAARYRPDSRHVGATILTRSGCMFSAVHIEAYVGRVTVCAEAIAVGMAATAGNTDIQAAVAVYHDGRIVSPCGMCRELLADYAPECVVIVGDREVIPIREWIPWKYIQDN